MANLQRIIEARLAQAVPSRLETSTHLERMLEARRLAETSEDREGFLERVNRFGRNVFGELELAEDATAADRFRADIAQFQAIAAGIADPIIGGVQAVTQIPGLFTDLELPTDRAANYLERMRHGILTTSEQAAVRAGVEPEAVADAHLFGELVGYTAPVVASLKASRLALGIRGSDLTLARMFQVDSAAGLIFGSTLLPEEDIRQRLINSVRESALFGVGGLMLNGLLFAAHGMRLNAIARKGQRELLQEDLARISRGGRVVFDEDTSIPLADLLNEEGYLAASPEAHALLEQFAFENALVAGVRDWADSGLSRGFVRGIGSDFTTVNQQLARAREQFPNLKFDVVKREGLFDLHFGMQGLNNQQKAQLSREGLFAGQLVQKGDASYLYVRRGKGDRMVVRTVDGKTTTITPDDVTVLPAASEEIPLPTAGEALYEDYRQFVFGKIRQASGVSGDVPETDLIRFIRQGQLPDLEGARMFETAGAITHPSELGLSTTGRLFRARLVQPQGELMGNEVAFTIVDRQGNEVGFAVGEIINDVLRITDMGASSNQPGAFGTGNIRDIARSMIEQLRIQGIWPRAITGVRASGTQPGQVAGVEVEQLMRGATPRRSQTAIFDEQFIEARTPEEMAAFDNHHQLAFSDDALQVSESTGALAHQTASGEVTVQVAPGSQLTDEAIAGQLKAAGMDPRGATVIRISGDPQIADQISRLPSQADDFAQAFLREGKHAGDLLGTEPVRQMDDAFDAWLRERGLDIEAGDIESFRQHFMQRMRSDIWALLPDEEARVMRRIHEETFRLIEAEELPFEALAGAKGFHVERSLTAPEITLRDINSGARMTFANEEVANRTLRRVVRSEKDPLFSYLTPGPHGGMALTTGFDPTDGVFTFETNIAPEEMLLDLPTQALTNVRDYMDALEEVSKIPVFTEGFERIDNAMLRMQRRLEPQAREIADIWSGIPRNRRKAVAEFWTRVEGTDLSGAALNRAARQAGLTAKEVRAFTRARRMFDLGAEQLGLPESRFISNYYSRVRAMYEEGLSQSEMLRRLSDDQVFHREFRFWAEMTRTGDLPNVELDPEIVMHKYFKALAYRQEVAPLENQVRRMINTRIRDLAPAQQEQVLRRALPETDQNSFVFPAPVRNFLKEYINNIRGDLSPGFASARRYFTRAMDGLGIKVDPRIVDELHSTYLSMQYGAAIGLRMALMNRNATQNLWMMYTRVGGKHGGRALERSMSLDGFSEALEAGAIRSTSAATPFYDAIFNNWFGPEIARGTGPLSMAAASVIRQGIRLGRVTRKTAERFLIPYGSGDQVNRAWAYHWQKLHTQEWLERFQAGRIDWDTFLEDGLPFFSDTIKSQFRRRYDRLGAEEALRYIGKQAADEAHFLYGAASSPAWMQRPFGRLFGVFGQWPLWAKQLYWNRMRNATPKQKAQFWGRTAAMTGLFANMTIQSGISMWNWIAPAAFGYTGGPVMELAILARDVIGRPMDQKAAALDRLMSEVGGLLLPGQLFYSEITTAMDQDDPRQAALMLTLGRPVDVVNFNFDIALDPDTDAFSTPPPRQQLPEIEGLPPIR